MKPLVLVVLLSFAADLASAEPEGPEEPQLEGAHLSFSDACAAGRVGIALARFIMPPRKEITEESPYLVGPGPHWMYDIEKDPEGRAIYRYRPLHWIQRPPSDKDDGRAPKITEIRRVFPRTESTLPPALEISFEEEGKLVLMEVFVDSEGIAQAGRHWGIYGEHDLADVARREAAGFKTVETLRTITDLDERIAAFHRIALRAKDPSLVVALEALRVPGGFRDEEQWARWEKALIAYATREQTPTYVREHLSMVGMVGRALSQQKPPAPQESDPVAAEGTSRPIMGCGVILAGTAALAWFLLRRR